LEAQEANVNPFQRYEHWDRRYGPHMRNLWLFLISLILLSVVISQNQTIDDTKRTADELAQLRRESIPVSNERTTAICDALKVLIEGQRESQSPATLKLFSSLFEGVDPKLLQAQLAAGRERTRQLDAARDRLVCTPLPQGP
jgi:hypothetical protein